MTERKDFSGWTNSVYSITNATRYVWDGYNIISEISHTVTPTLSYSVTNLNVWGLDLSGTLRGTGGIGGLLAVHKITTNGAAVYFPVYDGHGNVCDYIDTNGVVVAHREYDPFGRTIASTGPMKNDFTHWYSTKPYDAMWDLVLYPYRAYTPSLHFFLSKDPVVNHRMLYIFLENGSINRWEYLGLICIKWGSWSTPSYSWEYTGDWELDDTIGACVCWATKVRFRTAPGKDIGLFYCKNCTICDTAKKNKAGSWYCLFGVLPQIHGNPTQDTKILCPYYCSNSFNPSALGSPVF
jgi:RHS repeat-associated protein